MNSQTFKHMDKCRMHYKWEITTWHIIINHDWIKLAIAICCRYHIFAKPKSILPSKAVLIPLFLSFFSGLVVVSGLISSLYYLVHGHLVQQSFQHSFLPFSPCCFPLATQKLKLSSSVSVLSLLSLAGCKKSLNVWFVVIIVQNCNDVIT